MKNLWVTLMLVMIGFSTSAHEWWEEDDDLCFFGEIGGGVVMGSHTYRNSIGDNQIGWNGYIEGRYRLRNRHFDTGLHIGFGEFARKPDTGNNRNFGFYDIMFTLNYNLFASKNFTPFIGGGFGAVNNTAIDLIAETIRPGDPYDHYYYDYRTNKEFECGAMVRAGMQFGSHIRLTGGYKWLDRQSSHYFITLGFTYGFGSR